MFSPFLCRFVSCTKKCVEFSKNGSKVSVIVLQVMRNNFLCGNFVLTWLIRPQLANWIIDHNFGIELGGGNSRARSKTLRKYRLRP